MSDVPMWLKGTVLFSSPEGAVFDAAVIQLSNKYKFLRSPEWKIATVKEGVFIFFVKWISNYRFVSRCCLICFLPCQKCDQNYKQLPFTISGMPVYMIGHGLFEERHELKPSLMKGNVAKVTRVNGVPAIIQVGEFVLILFLQDRKLFTSFHVPIYTKGMRAVAFEVFR